MLKKIGEPAPPRGLKLKLYRAPLYLYRLKLGFLLGERFIRLQHWGRTSGRLRETVVEVIDQDKASHRIYSASGFGEHSQWFRNISANPHVYVTLKHTDYAAIARILSQEEATTVLRRYASAHPKSINGVARLSGYQMDGSEEDVIAFSKIVRIIEFELNGKKT